MQLGDVEAANIAREMIEQYPEENDSPDVLLQRAEVLLRIPGTPSERRRNAHQCRKIAKRILRQHNAENAPVRVSRALLLRSMASIALNKPGKDLSLQPTLDWLRMAVGRLLGEIKESRSSTHRYFLACSLMALAHVEIMEAKRWTGWGRRKLAEQALRNARQSMRLFRAMRCPLQTAETLWIQTQALLHIAAMEESTHHEEALRSVFEAMELLEAHPQAKEYTGTHMTQGTLYDVLRHDYLQLVVSQPLSIEMLKSTKTNTHTHEPRPLDSVILTHGRQETPEVLESHAETHSIPAFTILV